jgi:hypothetical protein
MAIGDVGDHGGPIIERAQLFIRLRGAGWLTGPFKSSDALTAFEATVASPYLSSLVQYRGVRRTKIIDFQLDPTDMGALGPDPRKFVAGNVFLIPDADIQKVVVDMANSQPQPLQDDKNFIFMVVISQDPIPIVPEQSNASGYHQSFITDDKRTLHYAVLLNQSSNELDHTWHYLPGVFSHELVESCTDPDPPGGFLFQDGDEICDLNDQRHVNLIGLDHEVDLAAYQSQLEQKAVVPTAYSLRIALGKRPTDIVPSVKALINQKSMLAAILARCNP